MQVINHQDGSSLKQKMRGIPVRIEVGPRDIENGHCVVVKRNDGVKTQMDLDENLPQAIHDTLETIHKEMYDKAAAFLNSHITRVNTLEEVGKVLDEKGGYVKMNWCGEEA